MKPEVSTRNFSKFHARIYQVCLFFLIPAIFISFIEPAEGIQCYCLDRDNKDTCKGKPATGCDEEDNYCWFTKIGGYVERAGCGWHQQNSQPNCLTNGTEQYCNCPRDCCNGADYWTQCDPISKDLAESLARPSKTAAAPTAKPAAKNGKGIKCICDDKENNSTCNGKHWMTCHSKVDACWHTLNWGTYDGAGCGRHPSNPNISCLEWNLGDDGEGVHCSCEKTDCCNGPDATPGNCNAAPKSLVKTLKRRKDWDVIQAAAAVHSKAEEALKKAEGAGSKKAAEAALVKAKAAVDKAWKTYDAGK